MAQPSTFAQQFVDGVNAKWSKDEEGQLEINPGRRYDRLVRRGRWGDGSCYAFVVRETGELLKPGGWNAPQRSAGGSLAVRYRLDNEVSLATAVEAADPYGSFLYLR